MLDTSDGAPGALYAVEVAWPLLFPPVCLLMRTNDMPRATKSPASSAAGVMRRQQVRVGSCVILVSRDDIAILSRFSVTCPGDRSIADVHTSVTITHVLWYVTSLDTFNASMQTSARKRNI